ncbi:MAG TPA: hypothetical protein VJ579_00770 [Candidatus Paceibacterota bacterium]|nr:hypothetical protein [Candidatus Paceibacterota bacterium]
MNDFLKMDIFFVVTTFVVLLWGIIGAVVLYYVIRVLKYIEQLSRTVAEGADELRGDLDEVRAQVREEGVRFKHVIQFFSGALSQPPKRSRKKSE